MCSSRRAVLRTVSGHMIAPPEGSIKADEGNFPPHKPIPAWQKCRLRCCPASNASSTMYVSATY